jgi:hypothetical protein
MLLKFFSTYQTSRSSFRAFGLLPGLPPASDACRVEGLLYSRMSSLRNPSEETVTEKLLRSHQDEEEYLNPYMSSTELKSVKRWRVLGIVSTGLFLASLIYNIFQPHSRSGNGHIPYIYCMFNQSIPFCFEISSTEYLFPSPSRRCHQL